MKTKRKRIKRKSARKAAKAGTYSITLNDFFRIDFKKRRAIRTSVRQMLFRDVQHYESFRRSNNSLS